MFRLSAAVFKYQLSIQLKSIQQLAEVVDVRRAKSTKTRTQ